MIGAEQPRQQPDHRAVARRDRRRMVLLQQLGGEHAAGDDPEAAAVRHADEGQRRQDAENGAAEERGLQLVRDMQDDPATGCGLRSSAAAQCLESEA